MKVKEIKINDINKIIKEYPKNIRFLLPILQDIQREYNYIPKESLEEISKYLEIPQSKIYSVATFYKALSLKPKGRYVIKVCNGTTCHIRGSDKILEEIKASLNIEPGETSKDGLFSVEIVNCVGACALAPVMVINGKYFGNMDKNKVKKVLKDYRRQ